ncbi:SDR family oxidoreductase [Paenibacillus koleovorans]|uniref:SDR family oxidoreductase n=1 Tax=Paenibacillus koleovorans TaxID=121608 RepID=UPI000FD87706|nr:SDR family oxidoreductase [Paenibacillus koleovorans]
MKILVTGATGALGSIVVETLLKLVPAANVAVSVRDPQKAEHWKAQGVDVRHGDFNDPESLLTAFQGIDRLLLISSSELQNRAVQHKNAIHAAKANGARFLAYTSLADAQESGLSLAPDHQATEVAIRESGIPYAFLRNNWYLENEAGSFQAVKNGAPWITSAGAGKVGWAARRDYAEAAAQVLAGEGHENAVYELSGPPLTQAELASILGTVLNREVALQQVDDETYGSIMSGAGVPVGIIPFLVSIQRGIREGDLDIVSDDFERLLGRPVTPLADVIRQLV